MNALLNLGEMGALAMHAMAALAEKREMDPEARTSVTELANGFSASIHTLHKVVSKLVIAGFVDSARGPAGGVRLAIAPQSIRLLDILEVMEGGLVPNGCLFAKRVCPPDVPCSFSCLTEGLEQTIRNYFTTTTLADLMNCRKKAGV